MSSKIEDASDEGPIPYLDMVFETEELDEAICACAASPDGTLVAVGTLDDEIFIYDAHTGDLKHELEGHLGGTNGLAFLRCSDRLASVGEDGALKIWHLGSEEPVHTLVCDGVDLDKTPTGWSVNNVAVSASV